MQGLVETAAQVPSLTWQTQGGFIPNHFPRTKAWLPMNLIEASVLRGNREESLQHHPLKPHSWLPSSSNFDLGLLQVEPSHRCNLLMTHSEQFLRSHLAAVHWHSTGMSVWVVGGPSLALWLEPVTLDQIGKLGLP